MKGFCLDPVLLSKIKRRGLVARVAQSAERSAVNRKVGGSNPPVSGFFIIFLYTLTI